MIRAAFLAALLTTAAFAAEPAATPAPKPQLAGAEAQFKAPDGWVLQARYQPAAQDQKTFVLLHGKGRGKEQWRFLARALTRAGYGVLGVDLRGHGQSAVGPDGAPAPWKSFKVEAKGQNQFADMVLDVQAAVEYLIAQGVEEETIGIIGADVGGSVGLKYAAVHPKVPMIALLSPGMNYQEVLTVNAVRAYKDRPILMVYSEIDKNSSRATPILYEFAKRAAGERNASILTAPAYVHGAGIPANRAMIRAIVDWIADPIKPEAPPAVSTDTVSPASTSAPQELPL